MAYRSIEIRHIKVSKMYHYEEKGYHYLSAQAIVCTNKTEFRIPFGAADNILNKCREKTISELIERLTWINMYLLNPIFSNTLGYAAHTTLEDSIQNSVLEFYERKYFTLLCDRLIFHNKLEEEFSVYKKGDSVLFIKNILISGEKYYLAYAFSNKNKVAFGMGKDRTREVAIKDAFLEKDVIQKTLSQEISNKLCLTYDEWHKFNQISMKIGVDHEIFCREYKNHENTKSFEMVGDDIVVYDLAGFVPKEVAGKRYVTFCFLKNETKKIEWLEEKGVKRCN